MNVCACMGRIGNDPWCPCEMERKGLEVTITENYISPELFQMLSREDRQTINRIKSKAFGMFIYGLNKEEE